MDSQVRVASLDRFQDFRSAYAKFGDAARNVLIGVDIEIRRMLEWLEKDQVAFWKGEIRRREEKVNEAKAALHRKRITATFGHTVSDTDEIVLLRRAQARLEAGEAKLKLVKQWYLLLEQEIVEYRGPSQQLNNLLDADVPKAVSSLDRMLDAIEGYLAVQAPTLEGSLGSAAGLSSAASTAAAVGLAATTTSAATSAVANPPASAPSATTEAGTPASATSAPRGDA